MIGGSRSERTTVKRYLLRRLLWSLVTLWGISVVTFLVSRLAPGGPLDSYAAAAHQSGGSLGAEDLQQMERILGLDRSLPVQYGIWLRRSVTLDFGRSLVDGREPVRTLLGRALAVSLPLQLAAICLIYLVGVPVGVWLAVHAGKVRERLAGLALFFLYSMPSFLLASLLIYTLCSGHPWRWFKPFGLRSLDAGDMGAFASFVDLLRHAILPVVCLAYAGWAVVARYTRAGLREELGQDYIRAARSRGLPEHRVLYGHALRTGILPVVTLFGNVFPALLGGSVVIETLFSIQGMGSLAFHSVMAHDYPTVMALSVVVGAATLLGFLVSDLLTLWLDPRVRLSGGGSSGADS